MAAELIGAKMLAPYFGSSLYVWATVLAVTLGGLAMGYFLGGLLSYRKPGPVVLFYVMLIASMLIMLMPFTAKSIMLLMGMYALIPSVIISTVVFLLPPVFMMGMVSPLIIRNITADAEHSGKVAGAVYAVSTVGGIISTFATGFYIIPAFGLTFPCIVTGIVLGVIPLLMIVRSSFFMVIFFALLCTWSFYKALAYDNQPGVRVLYMKEGLLGQLMVADYPSVDENGKLEGYNRMLYVNRISQSMLGADDSARHFSYVDIISNRAEENIPKGSKILVCGLGGGSLSAELCARGYEVDACELDERMKEVAEKYFGLPERVHVAIDDARHYIRSCKKKYDLIVLDMYRGEEIPSHCFSTEAFGDMRRLLNKGGKIAINAPGFTSGQAGLGMRSLYVTLEASGFHVTLYRTREPEAYSNLVFFAGDRYDFSGSEAPEYRYEESRPVQLTKEELADAIVMHDDRPVLDKLNLGAYATWRQNTILYFNGEMKKGRSIPIFK